MAIGGYVPSAKLVVKVLICIVAIGLIKKALPISDTYKAYVSL